MMNLSFKELWKKTDAYAQKTFVNKQWAILQNMFDAIINPNDRDSLLSNIQVLAAKCGTGKTTFLRSFILLCARYDIPCLCVTDRNDRLGETVALAKQNYPEKVIDLSNDKETSIDYSCLISTAVIALSLQRFNCLDAKTRAMLLRYSTGMRDFLLIDECLMDYETRQINFARLSAFSGRLRDTIFNPADSLRAYALAQLAINDISRVFDENDTHVKTWTDVFSLPDKRLETWNTTLQKMTDQCKNALPDAYINAQLHALEECRSCSEAKKITADIEKKAKEILPDEKYHLLQSHINELNQLAVYIFLMPELEDLINKNYQMMKLCSPSKDCMSFEEFKNLYTGKTLIRSVDGANKNETYRYLITAIDHLQKLPLGKIPIYVMDGTADICNTYNNKDLFSVTDFARPIPPVIIHHCAEQTGKSKLITAATGKPSEDGKNLVDKLQEILNQLPCKLQPKTTMLGTYKALVPLLESKKMYTANPIASFGDITGKNEWRSCDTYIKLGTLYMDNISAFLLAACKNPALWDSLLAKKTVADADKMTERMRTLSAISAGHSEQYSNAVTEELVNHAFCETIQEIYRLRCRNWVESPTAHDAIRFIFCTAGRPKSLLEVKKRNGELKEVYRSEILLRKLCDYFDAVAYEYHASVIKPPVADQIYHYIKQLPDGQNFTRADIARALGTDQSTINKAIQRRNDLNEYLNTMLHVPPKGRQCAVYRKKSKA